MKLGLEKYLYLDSCLHRWQCRPKLVAFVTLIFSFTFINRLAFLPIIIAITALFYILSKLPLTFLFERLRYPGIFILAVVILLPFLTGEDIIFSWAGLDIKKEGCLLMLVVVTRFVCILTITLVLLATSSFLTLIKSFNSFGLSPVIADMMLLTYRYLEQFSDRLDTMKKALKLKGFSLHHYHNRQLTIVTNLIGSLLIRSFDDSQRVYQAMKLRGYGQQYRFVSGKKTRQKIKLSHWIASLITICVSISLVVSQFIIYRST